MFNVAVTKEVSAYVFTEIEFTSRNIAFDLYHGGYHSIDIDNLVLNLTSAGNTITFINETWNLADDVDALFLTGADDGVWTVDQINNIVDWMSLGDKLLWCAGDSDYAGIFNPYPINNVLAALEAIVRLDGTSIEDPVYNDGAAYRVCSPYFGSGDAIFDGELVANLTKDMTAGVQIHGPCAILGYDNATSSYIDLRINATSFPNRVWTIMRYSEAAISTDSDITNNDLDLYAYSGTTGYYPAVVYEFLDSVYSHIIVSGEAIYSDYKYMYDQRTENGVYNEGVHFGQVLVNNILNNFIPKGEEIEEPKPLIHSSGNLEYTIGTTDNYISWVLESDNPDTYEIYREGVKLYGPTTWDTGDNISINVDHLAIGSYNYTIIVGDTDNNNVTSTIIVTVVDIEDEPEVTIHWWFSSGLLLLIPITLNILNKKRK